MALQSEQVGHAALVGGGQTALHSHAGGGGGGADVKSGTVSATTGSNNVTFNTAFASTPQVVLTVYDNIQLRDCLWQVTAVSTTGFTFEVDANAKYMWIATDAGNP